MRAGIDAQAARLKRQLAQLDQATPPRDINVPGWTPHPLKSELAGHRGRDVRDDVLPALGLSVTDAALQLGVTRAALSRVLNSRAGISPEMALRLDRWLGMQAGYDLWQTQKSAKPDLSKIKPASNTKR